MNDSAKPLVSILVPLYNHERFISQCLDSILQDPYPAKEIIVLDDGSADNSWSALQEWHVRNKSALPIPLKSKKRENRGLCRTLNELVSMASGEYIALLASDDYLLPGGIQARVDYLHGHPDKLAVFADCAVVDNDNQLICKSGIEELRKGRKKYLGYDNLCGYEVVFHWCVPGPVFMARRETYDIIGPYDETLLVEDWDYYLRLISRNAIGFLDYPVAAYRLHDRNMIKMISASDWIDWPLETVNKNISRLNGIRRCLLNVVKMRKTGEKYCFTGKPAKGVAYRIVAKFLEKIVRSSYEVMVILHVNHNVRLLKNKKSEKL